ncbi:hypothetical protein BABINDRAFT_161232 [Babjeviella inositovora NRRL Y-12698]|uniref:Phosphatidate cytidylyltransferase, mitochondrial n=1 Tax=Babjeviella inositovora NRRL Y-12698 TaxID=984486 RepID=A0A1E3QTL3_9ASCO|nr:uncharacterized protein BABINDRAFT_161232 [Babjeviella inositovora NRRL Y-12698]ODQ80267.1 hypothetical protein BABINDRAFT_161232 [Babjeviella inositovora NRRL Y-12698]
MRLQPPSSVRHFSRSSICRLQPNEVPVDPYRAHIHTPPSSPFHYKRFRTLNDLPSVDFASNQHIPAGNEQALSATLSQFNAPIRYALGYGSGVFEQAGYSASDKKPQIDMIFAVTYPSHFHLLNLNQFAEHYSGLRVCGSDMVAWIQETAAGMYFNPFVEMNSQVIKYGVVSVERVCLDLENWDSLYIAGRLHKPVKVLRDDPRIRFVNQFNLRSVINLSMMLNSKKKAFTEGDLYRTITGISYKGDPRVRLGGENPNKIGNIVSGQYENFRLLYSPLLLDASSNQSLQIVNEVDTAVSGAKEYHFEQNEDPKARALLLQTLPLSFRRRLYALYASKYGAELAADEIAQRVLLLTSTSSTTTYTADSCSGFALAIAQDKNLVKALNKAIISTVSGPALGQMVKGIVSAGIVRSAKYAWDKKVKNWQAKKA